MRYFFIILLFFLYLTLVSVSMNALHHGEGLGMAALEKTGPNDAICVVWATGEFFLYYSTVFSLSKVFFSVYERFTTPSGLRDGCVGDNGPK